MDYLKALVTDNNNNNNKTRKSPVKATAHLRQLPTEEEKDFDIPVAKLEIIGSFDTNEDTKFTENTKRAIIFVIDVSGSMSGGRITTVRNAVIPFVTDLCESPDIILQLITFQSTANSVNIPSLKDPAKQLLERVLQAGGGTDFSNASTTLVKVASDLLHHHPTHKLTVIVCSDGEVSKGNAQQAHQTWKQFVQSSYYAVHNGENPYVESIGISNNHDADILDGFILNDDSGNYTRTADSASIIEAFERAAQDATLRTSYKLDIRSVAGGIFLNTLYHKESGVITDGKSLMSLGVMQIERIVADKEFMFNVWVNHTLIKEWLIEAENIISENVNNDEQKSANVLFAIFVNDVQVNIEMSVLENEGLIQQFFMDYYHTVLTDMINVLRNLRNEEELKIEAQMISVQLESLSPRFEKVTAAPAELTEMSVELLRLLDHCGDDEIEKRAQTLKHYKRVKKSWSGHMSIVRKFNDTLRALKQLLQEILTGSTRMQEIRQHICALHYKKKHAKRLNKLILTEEQLRKRQVMYDSIVLPTAESIAQLDDEYGSGCFLSTLTLKECAEDGESLWICGRVNRTGGLSISNPEIIRIEYISPNLVCGSYFDMAIDIKPDGFYDGSRMIINARLFPVYGNYAHLKCTKQYIWEVLSHTLSGRVDIKINEYSTLSAVLGYLIASEIPSEINIRRIFELVLPSYSLFAQNIHVFPYKNSRNKEIDVSQDKILLRELFRARVLRYGQQMISRCSSLVSNVQCLFGDALLANEYGVLLENSDVWLLMVMQRLRSMIKGRLPGDMAMFEKMRKAQNNNNLALRVLVRGTDMHSDTMTELKSKDTDMDIDVDVDVKQDVDDEYEYFQLRCRELAEEKIEYTADFTIYECRKLSAEMDDFCDYDGDISTPAEIEMCAQLLSRVYVNDLVQAHRFFRIKNGDGSDINRFKFDDETKEKFSHRLTFIDLCHELGLKHITFATIRALCGFCILYYSNKTFQNDRNIDMLDEMIERPRILLQHLHEIVISECKRGPRSVVARVKHKSSKPVDLTKRLPRSNIIRLMYDQKSKYWANVDMGKCAQLLVSCIGDHRSGKSTLLGRLITDLHCISPKKYRKIQKNTKYTTDNEFSKLMNNPQSFHSSLATLIHSNYNNVSTSLTLIDTPDTKYYKNVVKCICISDACILCISASDTKLKKGYVRQLLTICNTFGIQRIIICISMMDSVAYSENIFIEICSEIEKIVIKRGMKKNKLIFIPVSGLIGDNITHHSSNMDWYHGFTVKVSKKETLSGVTVADAVQLLSELCSATIRRRSEFKDADLKLATINKYAVKGVGTVVECRVLAGTVVKNDEIVFMPSKVTARVTSVWKYEVEVGQAFPSELVSMRVLGKELQNIVIGDVAFLKSCKHGLSPYRVTREIHALVFVSSAVRVKRIRQEYSCLLMMGSEKVRCSVKEIKWKLDPSKPSNKLKGQNLYLERNNQAEVVLTLQKSVVACVFSQTNGYGGRFVTIANGDVVFIGKIVGVS